MNRHVQEDPAGDLDVLDRRRTRIATDNVHKMRLTDFPAFHRLANASIVGIESSVEPDLQRHAGLINSRQSPVNLAQIVIDRLLAEDVLTRRRRVFDDLRMGVGR